MGLIVKMIALSIVMIFGLSAVLIGVLSFFVDRPFAPPPLLVGAGAFGMAALWLSLRGLVVLNEKWKRSFVEDFHQHPEKILGGWEIPPQMWRDLAEHDRRSTRQMAPFAGTVSGLLVAITTALAFWSPLGPWLSGGIAMAAGGAFGAICWIIITRSGATAYRNRIPKDRSDVVFRADGMLVNGISLVPWTPMTADLVKVVIEDLADLDFTTLTVYVRQSTGQSSVVHLHHVPVPEEAKPEAERIAAQLTR